MGSQDGAVNIWTRIGDGQSGWNPGRGRKFFLLYMDRGPHPASCSVGIRILSGVKQLSNDVDS